MIETSSEDRLVQDSPGHRNPEPPTSLSERQVKMYGNNL